MGVWVPEASGKFPVVYFNVGVAGLIPPGFYSILLSHIASHGFVVVSPFTFTSLPTSEYNAEWMSKVDNWAEDHLLDKIKSEGTYFFYYYKKCINLKIFWKATQFEKKSPS